MLALMTVHGTRLKNRIFCVPFPDGTKPLSETMTACNKVLWRSYKCMHIYISLVENSKGIFSYMLV